MDLTKEQQFVERRKHPRKEVYLVMEITGKEGVCNHVLTNNVSAGGVYFKTLRGNDFDIGIDVSFTIFLSASLAGKGTHFTRLVGDGKVVRLEKFDNHEASIIGNEDIWTGVAMQFNKPLVIN